MESHELSSSASSLFHRTNTATALLHLSSLIEHQAAALLSLPRSTFHPSPTSTFLQFGWSMTPLYLHISSQILSLITSLIRFTIFRLIKTNTNSRQRSKRTITGWSNFDGFSTTAENFEARFRYEILNYHCDLLLLCLLQNFYMMLLLFAMRSYCSFLVSLLKFLDFQLEVRMKNWEED